MPIRVNVNLPEALFKRSLQLVKQGHFSNFSEVVRNSLRKEIAEYKEPIFAMNEDERRLLAMLSDADKRGQLLDEKEMRKHGLKIRA